ncbi:hypothetical protein [Saccharopolyspora shandongensis]|uniref:hypothetical protein n=1 Tax=Saccharopolyspora shandongensis TaxID=418495 RepID=UPI0033DE8A3A
MTCTAHLMDARTTPKGRVLISGASIAGPTLAYWLTRYGYAVTVVERAGAVRSGGYPIDVRGTALEVVRRMGILPRLRDVHIDLRRLTFLDGNGSEVASVHPHAVTGGVEGRDLEVRRGDLTDALYAAVRDDVEFLFNDSIDTLVQSGDGVEVTFRGGGTPSVVALWSERSVPVRDRRDIGRSRLRCIRQPPTRCVCAYPHRGDGMPSSTGAARARRLVSSRFCRRKESVRSIPSTSPSQFSRAARAWRARACAKLICSV